jgi:hypothetical protein
VAVQFQVFAELTEGTTTQTWEDRQIQIRTIFRPRTGAWYIDLFELDGTPIVFGRRVSPSFLPLLGVGFEGESLPRGQTLVVLGPEDPYEKVDLGDTLELLLLSDADIDTLRTDPVGFETFVELV